ncbi:zinc ribbon domain-containing protein [Natronocalculus amylovorans]|uniref:Zinc ribbon domain-containing protein n=1 Tax=Natronocalculus amylovorans TaxID=2917812 RepID=A0AAE3FYP3_9EURY|nr:zinc ribbon domain-containing protein [Natronocalculus amylovorans]MCL9817611.1 zinc ribbon domain-containing protein [Natronocalculus amylovorans]
MPSDDYSVFDEDRVETTHETAADRSDPGDATDTEAETPSLHDEEGGCPKCGCTEVEFDDIATTGTGLSKLFDIQNRRFTVISCTDCGYSELYRGQSKGNVVDFFFG